MFCSFFVSSFLVISCFKVGDDGDVVDGSAVMCLVLVMVADTIEDAPDCIDIDGRFSPTERREWNEAAAAAAATGLYPGTIGNNG